MDTQKPVFVIASLRVEDMARFQTDYVAPLKTINDRHGVETVVASPHLQVMEGDATLNVMAVLRFPSQAALDGWYADPDYQPLIATRQAATDQGASTLIALTPMA